MLKSSIKLILIICSAILGLSAVALSFYIWQASPFFNMNLVFADAILVLLMSALVAVTMLSSSN